MLGLHVLAKSNVSNSRVLHCANILAQWIDNDEDGIPDNPSVHQHLVDNYASMLGAQNYPWRIAEIADEWELPTPKLMMQHNMAMVNMLQDPQWGLTTVLPDATYNPSAPCPADLDGIGSVGVGDVLALIDAWGGTDNPADIDGSGTVGVGDLLVMIDFLGLCP